jgi:hypothetical protein
LKIEVHYDIEWGNLPKVEQASSDWQLPTRIDPAAIEH